jgi:hypothetical protein
MLAVLFGLSMDYEVFLVSRIREEWAASGDNRQAVRTGQATTGQATTGQATTGQATTGQATTGRAIIAAATIMICVFSAFILSGQQITGEFGLGLAGAVLLEAFLLRTLLVPALMHLAGHANWWLPGCLDRILPHLWLPLVMMALVGLLAFNFPVILPVLASDTFHGDGGTYGLLSTMLSIGSVAGSLGVGLIHHPRRQYLMTAALAFGVFLAATGGAPDIAVACLTLLATGAAAFTLVTLCSTTLQLHSSPAYRGRIMALWVYVYIRTTPVGSIITGAIISAAGVRAALLTGAAACLVAAAVAARVHTPPHADATLTDLASA